MEAIAFVEVLGRDGRVVMRQPIGAFPVRVGRAYDNEVILDDPFVAAHHLEVREEGSGKYVVQDLSTRNGMRLGRRRNRAESGEIGPEETVRIGQTRLRIRSRDYGVAEEVSMHTAWWRRQPILGVLAVLIVVAIQGLRMYRGDGDPWGTPMLLGWLLVMGAGIIAWSAGWSFAGQVITGHWQFGTHLTVVSLWILLGITLDEAVGSIGFAAGVMELRRWQLVGTTAIVAGLGYQQLRLLSQASRLRLGLISLFVAVLCCGSPALVRWMGDRETSTNMTYNSDVRPPGWRLAGSVTPERFMKGSADLRALIDHGREAGRSKPE